MSDIYHMIINFSSDDILFWVVQGAIILFSIACYGLDTIHSHRAGRGSVSLTVTRSDKSMGKFYGMYAAVNGLLVAICFTVDTIQNHRIIWAIIDMALLFYIFLLNQYVRNKIVQLSNYLTKVENR